MLPTLYTLTDDFSKLMEIEEVDDVVEELTLIVAGQIEKKAENVCKFVRMLEAAAEAFKAEERRIGDKRKALEKRAEQVREYMKQALLNANIDKVTAGTFKVSVSLSPGSVAIDDLSVIPPRYMTIIPEQHVPDKAAIKAAIKAGQPVPGARIEAGFTMRIQ